MELLPSRIRFGSKLPTYLLMRGAGFYKDNRLLPQGWSSLHPNAALVAPQGIGDDPDWLNAGDAVDYRVPIEGAVAPLTVEVELLYQPLSARYANELFSADTPETRAFRDMYENVVRFGELVASTTAITN